MTQVNFDEDSGRRVAFLCRVTKASWTHPRSITPQRLIGSPANSPQSIRPCSSTN